MTKDEEKIAEEPEEAQQEENPQQETGDDAPHVVAKTKPAEVGSPAPVLTDLYYCDDKGVWHKDKACCGHVWNTATDIPSGDPVCSRC